MDIAKINRALQRRIFNEIFADLGIRVRPISRIYVFSIGQRGQLSCSRKRIRPIMGVAPELFEERFSQFRFTRMYICDDLYTSGHQPIGVLHVECYQDEETGRFRLLTSLRMAEDLSEIDFRIYALDHVPSMVLSNGGLVHPTIEFRRVA